MSGIEERNGGSRDENDSGTLIVWVGLECGPHSSLALTRQAHFGPFSVFLRPTFDFDQNKSPPLILRL